ncbi:MAG: VCBS repeat-containing protein [Burkholderiales bacterium]|nr:VCBS repeat-containing protein [Burkholderiales bacterium]
MSSIYGFSPRFPCTTSTPGNLPATARAILPAGVRGLCLGAALASALAAAAAGAESIVAARYTVPVERYGHFALGWPHEYANLGATTSGGRKLALQLPQDEVFEDLAPRLVKLAPEEPVSILAIVSRRDHGSRLVIIRLDADGLKLGAQSAAIGTQNRWLNPVGVADLDGDGRAEIAAVITPHIGGTLKVYREIGGELGEIAALAGFSNHVYGTTELALSAPVSIAGRMRLLVPDATRLQLRIIALEGGRLVEIGRCDLSAPVTGPIEPLSPGRFAVGLASGRQVVAAQDCLKQ